MLPFRETLTSWRARTPSFINACVVLAPMLLVAIVGLIVDPRTITNAPAWLKPAKFAISGMAMLLSLAWMFRDVQTSRALTIVSAMLSWILVVEVAAIYLQAARGTSSHFNINTPLDTLVYSSMGVGIGLVWLLSAVLLWLHLRVQHHDRHLALAFRLGLVLQIVGSGTGWIMTTPKPEQIAAITRGERPFVAGAHTVGAPDGGRGLPITHWSTAFGDVRVAHFVGLHALQLLPLLLLAFRRIRGRTDDVVERFALIGVSVAYGALFVGTLLQALNGHPLFPTSSG